MVSILAARGFLLRPEIKVALVQYRQMYLTAPASSAHDGRDATLWLMQSNHDRIDLPFSD